MIPKKHVLNPGRDALPKSQATSGDAGLPDTLPGGDGVRLIILAYVGAQAAWIFFTDHLMSDLFTSIKIVEEWSIFKGFVSVTITGGLLYVLISRMAARLKGVTASLRKSEAKYRLLVENSPDGICILRDHLIVFANSPALRLFGAQEKHELIGKSAFELLHPDCHDEVRQGMKEVLEGRSIPLRTRKIVRLDGAVVEADVASIPFESLEGPAIKLLFRDISERQQQNAEIRRLNRIYEVLSQVNHAVIRISSRAELLREVCRILCEVGEFKMAWIGWLNDEGNEVTPVAWHGAGAETKTRRQIKASTARGENRSLVATAISEGLTSVANDYANDPRTRAWQENAEKFEHRSAISLPIRNGGKICGVLLVYSAEIHCFQTREIKLLEQVAVDVSFDLDRMDQEALRHEAQEAQKKSEEHLRLLINHLHAGVVVHAPDTRIILSNPEAARLLGLSQAQMQGKEAANAEWRFTDEQGTPLALQEYPVTRVIASGESLEGSVLGIEHGDEPKTWVLVNAYPEFDAQNALTQVIVTFVDLTERKIALEAIQENEEKFRTLFTASRDAILLLDETHYIDCNEAALHMFGCPSKELFCSRKLGDISAPTQPDGRESGLIARKVVDDAIQNDIGVYEWVFIRFDGTPFSAEISLSLFELKGRPVVQAVIRDTSWRKKAEQQLRQLSRAVEQSPISVVITDTKGNIEYINPRFTTSSGYTAEEVIGKNPRVLKSGEFPQEGYKVLWETISAGHEWRGEFHNRKKNGELFWESASICPITDESGTITHFLAVKEDITERKRTEEALRKSEEKFVKAFNTAPAVVAIISLNEGRYIEVNDAFVEFSGYTREETLGHTVLELGMLEEPQEMPRLIGKLLAEGSVRNQEYQYRTKKGELRIGLISGELIEVEGEQCIVYISLDITERKQMEEKFLRAQRMESIGALAGGIAHDLNNILAPIMMSSSMLQDEEVSEQTRRKLVIGIEEAAQRGANVVNQVLTFARGVKGQHATLDPRVLANQIRQIVKETFPKSITFSLSLPENLWNITGDSTHLQQVLLNLCVNARDAMPDGGSLSLGLENYEVDSTFAFMVPEAKPGCYVRFKVTDNGLGMEKAIVERIFEPFFTTKEPGKGTGLGLSTVIGIVRSHGGFLKVETELGKGSVFNVFLPATTDAVLQTGRVSEPSISRGHGETILVVDDEPEIVQVISAVLNQNDWVVLTATDGLEGVAEYLNHSDEIKAVITDMVMPNLDGLGLIRSIRKLAPDLPILVSSGYSNDESRHALSDLQVQSFLKKPFSARQLIAEVVSLLYGKTADGK